MSSRWRSRFDDGFALIETVVAILVFGLIAAGTSSMIITGLAAQRSGSLYQQGTALGEQALESARSLGYAGLVMSSSELAAASDPLVLSSCSGLTGSFFFVPDGLAHCESIPTATSGTTLPLRPTGLPTGYSVSEYVTWVDRSTQGGSGQDYKRVTVHVSWTDHGQAKSYSAMTLVSAFGKAALPTRGFSISTSTNSAFAMAGSVAVFPAAATNTGTASDVGDVAATQAATAWPVTFYADPNGNGGLNAYGAATNPVLTDTNANGAPDTGALSKGSSTPLLFTVQVPANAVAGVYGFTLTVTSGADPTKSASVALQLTVTSSSTPVPLYLHNSAQQPLQSSSATLDMPMDTNASQSSVDVSHIPNLATDVKGGVHGRYLKVSANGSSESAAANMADWIFGLASGYEQVSGSITVQLWMQACGSPSAAKSASLVVYFGVAGNGHDGAGTTWLTSDAANPVVTPTTTDCTGSAAVPATITLPALATPLNLSNKTSLELKVVATGTTDAIIGYDSTNVQAAVTLPVVAT